MTAFQGGIPDWPEEEHFRNKSIEDFIIKMYGERCKNPVNGCLVCDVWETYDEYLKTESGT